ncbi:hypothetical protein FQZ97_939700 [compost metagenome]
MVQSVVAIDLDRETGVPQQPGDLMRQRRGAPDRVLDAVERLREAAEVVDRVGCGRGRDGGTRQDEVGRCHDDGPGVWQSFAKVVQEAAGRRVLDRHHGRAMRQEEAREVYGGDGQVHDANIGSCGGLAKMLPCTGVLPTGISSCVPMDRTPCVAAPVKICASSLQEC